ncbi:Fungal specific transcription factor domain-containing protein [Cladophialophora immunda]|nr:Fungal specific transcription factor domain-containing protein [Cladophialophora immunda]
MLIMSRNSVGEVGKPPCLECFRVGHDCTLASSRRGGDYSLYRARRSRTGLLKGASNSVVGSPGQQREQTAAIPRGDREAAEGNVSGDLDEEPIYAELRNPSDALQILTRARSRSCEETGEDGQQCSSFPSPLDDLGNDDAYSPNMNVQENHPTATPPMQRQPTTEEGIAAYKLVIKGVLKPEDIKELISLYAERYHPFLPIVPKYVLLAHNINEVATNEPFLLTVIMTIASRFDPAWDEVHHHCWTYTKELLLDILLALPHTHHVNSVEGLLLLSDWLPDVRLDYPSSVRSTKGSFTEDGTAWSLVGQAVRHAYLLRLDRTSFREEFVGQTKDQIDRKRLAWIYVYLADRQISVRMGQSFWSRGPSLSTRFTANDFPSLLPSSNDEDYASVLQATIELTQLLHNSHDILYSSRARTLGMTLTGDYSRYLDDLLSTWSEFPLGPKLRCTLSLMYEYLCLYVNAFSFQAIVTRASGLDKGLTEEQSSMRSKRRHLFPRGVMASPDGRYVFEAIRAAKMVLKIIGECDSTMCLRYLPTRYYLYGIYSGVFLYKAEIFGALTSSSEQLEVKALVRKFILALRMAALGKRHIAQRYSELIRGLWFPTASRVTGSNSMSGHRLAGECDHVSQHERLSPRNTTSDDAARHSELGEFDHTAYSDRNTRDAAGSSSSREQQRPAGSNLDDLSSHTPQSVFDSMPVPDSSMMLLPDNFFSAVPALGFADHGDAFLESVFGPNEMNIIPPFTDNLPIW